MKSNPENRNKTRFAHESKVTLESTEIGFRMGPAWTALLFISQVIG
jgi:hypothetical protein